MTTMQSVPFSLSVDGSNDTDLYKMNPLTVQIFDIRCQKVCTRFLDMCTTSGVNAATLQAIIDKMKCSINAQHTLGQLHWCGVD